MSGAGKAQLTEAQRAVLEALRPHHEWSDASDLAEPLGMRPGSVGTVLLSLRDRGWAEKTPDPDRRYRLTPAGLAALEEP